MSKRVVRCKTEAEKRVIREGWDDEMKITKTAYAAKHGISLRTLNRIFDEGKVDPQQYQEDVVEWNYFISANDVTVLRNEESRSISRGFPRFNSIRKELIDDPSDEELEVIFRKMSVESSIEDMTEGDIHVKDGKVHYGTFEIKNSLADHLLKMLSKREDVKPFARFMNKLMLNPKPSVVEELYPFMQHNSIEISEDGDIIGYKAVTSDFKDKHTKTVDNSLGKTISMPWSEVDDNPDNTCSRGYHVAAWRYAYMFASSGEPIIFTLVNPRDVVSVPVDYNGEKMRVCSYKTGEVVEYKQ